MTRVSLAIGMLALVAVGATTARAEKCPGVKLKAVGKKESGLPGCQAKVAVSLEQAAEPCSGFRTGAADLPREAERCSEDAPGATPLRLPEPARAVKDATRPGHRQDAPPASDRADCVNPLL